MIKSLHYQLLPHMWILPCVSQGKEGRCNEILKSNNRRGEEVSNASSLLLNFDLFSFLFFLYLGYGRLLITWLALCLYMHFPLPNRWYAPQSSTIVVKYWSGISCGSRGLIPMSSLLEFGTTHKVMILNLK